MSYAQQAKTRYVARKDGRNIAYRIMGGNGPRTSQIPLVMHMHFRGNMDFWDPSLLNTLAATRQVIIFDQVGVGRSFEAGEVPTTFQGWADDLISFIEALSISKIDLFGFSMGGAAVQMVALTRPDLVRKLILAGTTASTPGPNEIGQSIVWPRDQAPAEPFKALNGARAPDETENAVHKSFFYQDEDGRKACHAYMTRLKERQASGEHVDLQLLAKRNTTRQGMAFVNWSTYDPKNSFDRLAELKLPVLVQNGDNDLLIPTSRSWELARRIDGAELIIYPRAGHGFLWQYSEKVGRDVQRFLDQPDRPGAKL